MDSLHVLPPRYGMARVQGRYKASTRQVQGKYKAGTRQVQGLRANGFFMPRCSRSSIANAHIWSSDKKPLANTAVTGFKTVPEYKTL